MDNLFEYVSLRYYRYQPRFCQGQGAFGKVYKGLDTRTGVNVAIKQIPLEMMSSEQADAEVSKLSKLNHPNVVRFLESFKENNVVYIITELCEDGSLDELETGDIAFELEMLRQVCEAFDYVRQFNIIHRDLNPCNILVHKGVYKVIDFGISKEASVYQSTLNSDTLGAIVFLSPQILMKCTYTGKCDVWSLGVIIFQRLFGHYPWKAGSSSELFAKIIMNPYPHRLFGQSFPPIIDQLLNKTLRLCQKDRADWTELIDLLKGSIPTALSQPKSIDAPKQQTCATFQKVRICSDLCHWLRQNRRKMTVLQCGAQVGQLITALSTYIDEPSIVKQGLVAKCCEELAQSVCKNLFSYLTQRISVGLERKLLQLTVQVARIGQAGTIEQLIILESISSETLARDLICSPVEGYKFYV